MIVTRKEVANRLKISRVFVCDIMAGKELGYKNGHKRSGVIYDLKDVAKSFNLPEQVLERVMKREDELLTPDEAAMLMGVGCNECHRLSRKGLIERYRISARKYRFTLSSILKYLKERKPERYEVALNYAIYRYGILIPEVMEDEAESEKGC